MASGIDARDVLDPNAVTTKGFGGQVVGYFRRTGPNSWDDYAFCSEEGGELAVFPKIDVQLENFGCDLRIRHNGQVVRLRWVPEERERRALKKLDPAGQRAYFIENYLDSFQSAAGQGAAAVIASKLRG